MYTGRKTILATILIITVGISSVVLADTCPTELKRDQNGIWYSKAKPGWKSHKAIPDGVTVSAKNFGGVVYSPKRHRLACVYKGSDGKWVALVSNVHHGIVIDKKAKDDAGTGPAWQYNKKYQDYACGQPKVTDIKSCQFQLAD